MARGRVYKRGSTWSWRVDDPRAAGQGARRQISRGGFSTKREAEAALSEALVGMRDATHVDPSKLTLSDFLSQWLQGQRTELRPSTHHSYEVAVRRVGPVLGAMRLQAIQPVHLERFYREMLDAGLAAKTVRNTHVVIGRALGDADRLGLIPRNPARAVRAPRVERREHSVWSTTQIAEFLGAVEGTWIHTPAAIAALTGMRRAEILGLRWSDVDLERRTLRVSQTVTAVAGEVIVSPPKTESSRRLLTVGPVLVSILRSRRVEQAAHRLLAGELWVDRDLVVTDEVGRPIHPDRLSRAFSAAVDESKLPRIRLHDLRHSFATNAMVSGVPAKVVSEQLGHSGISITLDTYTAVPEATARAAAESIESQIFPQADAQA